jgi:hypothetical protein
MEGHLASTRERTDTYRSFLWKSEGQELLGRNRHSWEKNIKMNVQEIGWECCVEWIDQARSRDRGTLL